MYYYQYKTIIGDIFISVDDSHVLEISFTKNNNFEQKETSLILETIKQIRQYLSGRRESFDLPLKIKATKFQKKVYFDLLKIPYGSVKTYNQVATSINNPKANQAVGSACSKNKFIIVIPCHRVIASTGLINGYAGGLKAKTFLLKLEGLQVKDNKIIKLWQIVNICNINYVFMEITGNDFWNDK